MRNRAPILGLLLAAVSLTGCVGYRLGSMLPPDIRSVYVPMFVNETTEPLIEDEATRAAIKEFQKDGSLQVAGTPEEADALLKVTLVGYDLSPLTYDITKKTAANEYRLTLTAALVMTRAKGGDVLAESPNVQGESTFVVSGDFTSSKQRGLPVACQDLAHDLIETVVETWR